MGTFTVQGVTRGTLEFYERTPADTRLPVERFLVRLTDQDLSIMARVYATGGNANPASLFAHMAAQWKGWQGDMVWASAGGEMSLSCRCDRAGHVFLGVVLRSGPTDNDWSVQTTVEVEAGQLDELASAAAAFF